MARDRLRFRLENIFNELDLLMKNERADQSDLRRLQNEFEVFQVFERIPFEEDFPELEGELKRSVRENRLAWFGIRRLQSPEGSNPGNDRKEDLGVARKVPREVYTDQPRFRFREDQLVEKIPFALVLGGDEPAIREWIRRWKSDEPVRLIELLDVTNALAKRPDGRWELRAQAYRFRREIRFPRLMPRDPLELLPIEARRDPAAFARREPFLWNLVERAQKLAPLARPHYEARRQFLLEQARMDFFLSKVLPKSR